jgi:hypothetical protein
VKWSVPHNNPLQRSVIDKVLGRMGLRAAPEQVRLARVLTRHPAVAEGGTLERAKTRLRHDR